MKPVNPEDYWNLRPGLPGLYDFLRLTALFVGYVMSGFGWLLFFDRILFAGLLTPGDGHFFRLIGQYVVVGWLMLRFAAGLFPFSRRLLK
jgi:hypothetical protein